MFTYSRQALSILLKRFVSLYAMISFHVRNQMISAGYKPFTAILILLFYSLSETILFEFWSFGCVSPVTLFWSVVSFLFSAKYISKNVIGILEYLNEMCRKKEHGQSSVKKTLFLCTPILLVHLSNWTEVFRSTMNSC